MNINPSYDDITAAESLLFLSGATGNAPAPEQLSHVRHHVQDAAQRHAVIVPVPHAHRSEKTPAPARFLPQPINSLPLGTQERVNSSQPPPDYVQQERRPARLVQRPQPITTNLSPEQALQAYLIRQQLIAGIQPQNVMPMRQSNNNTGEKPPAVIQISNEGVTVPKIPPAQFTGGFHPLPRHQMQYMPPPNASIMETRPPSTTEVMAQETTTMPARPVTTALSTTAIPQQSPTINHLATNHWNPAFTMLIPPRPLTPHSEREEEFDLLQAFTYFPHLAVLLTSYLSIDDLVTLGSTSKTFHYFLSAHISGVIQAHITHHPSAANTFPFHCYPKLCTHPGHWHQHPPSPSPTPGPNTPTHPHPHPQTPLTNLLPSLPWLRLLTHRDHTTKEILHLLLTTGYALPPLATLTLHKFWFLMDIPDNARREWTIRNPRIWQDGDIFLAVLFLVQLDMYLREQRDQKSNSIRRLIMAQPTLTFLRDYMRGWVLQSNIDMLAAFVRWRYLPGAGEEGIQIFGVPGRLAGGLQFEGYGRGVRGVGGVGGVGMEKRVKLVRPDELVLREMARRGLRMQDMYRDLFLLAQGAKYFPVERLGVSWVKEMMAAAEGLGWDWMDAVRLD
ncbi:uncharacterized protein BO80DRAFT_464026 [Aspergillus ibericus CBS 121593]|uniref:Uncharacterized protein n=1 Tax=Aspergillus ibericus CBS 121593 TaxID=1448316 RepID=A0A395H4U0_9EURO|nr:hypothetical protein BO80DRAFT_464026 [Aspergillus ibericus CBS 121593]RAL01908.1 hypothetical protein BO80DRAFT_464026 [Aspergillus ibericus CBS 121593]